MSPIEVEGRTVGEAIEQALEILQVPRGEVRIEILVDSSRGIFGLGAQRARIRAAVIAQPAGEVALSTTEVSRETDAISARARESIQVILEHLVDSPQIVERVSPGLIRFELSGANTGLLIGKAGHTLDALEYLVNRIVFRDERGPVPARIEVDVADYRVRRAEVLADLALRSADKAVQTGRPVLLNPMSPRERRIVHLALKDDPRVISESEGQGECRRVIIKPAPSR